jgi:hypothetical protein
MKRSTLNRSNACVVLLDRGLETFPPGARTMRELEASDKNFTLFEMSAFEPLRT